MQFPSLISDRLSQSIITIARSILGAILAILIQLFTVYTQLKCSGRTSSPPVAPDPVYDEIDDLNVQPPPSGTDINTEGNAAYGMFNMYSIRQDPNTQENIAYGHV